MLGRRLVVVAAVLFGITLGLGVYTFGYARGASYLTTDPAACANCHVMEEHFAAWQKSSHRAAATCRDCHMPHGPIGKYATKAANRFLPSLAYTTRHSPYPPHNRETNRSITTDTCRHY